eukprot:361424-Chlamydomonas_euryale.AAC.1
MPCQAASLGRAWVLERVRLVGVDLARRANFLGLPVDAVELDLVPLLCGPLDPCGDALHPRARRRLDARLDLGPVQQRLATAVGIGGWRQQLGSAVEGQQPGAAVWTTVGGSSRVRAAETSRRHHRPPFS